MKSTKQSVSFSSSKSIYFLHGQGQRRLFEPISQQKVASLVIHRRVRKFCAWTGKNSGKKKQPCGAQSTSLIHFIQDVSMFQRIPMLQRCLSTAHSWEKLSQGLRDESRLNISDILRFLFFLTQFLGGLRSDCKVMVYF